MQSMRSGSFESSRSVKNLERLSKKQSNNQATDQSGTVDFFPTHRSDSLTISEGDIPKVDARLKIVRNEGRVDGSGTVERLTTSEYSQYPGSWSPDGKSLADGRFNDYVTHFPSRDQTVTWPSSVDPWHAATDLDESRGVPGGI